MNRWNDLVLFLGFILPPPPFLGPIFLICFDGTVGTASNVGNCILASLFVRPASDESSSERTESNEANCFGISRVFVRTASKVGNSLGGGRTFLLRLGLGGVVGVVHEQADAAGRSLNLNFGQDLVRPQLLGRVQEPTVTEVKHLVRCEGSPLDQRFWTKEGGMLFCRGL